MDCDRLPSIGRGASPQSWDCGPAPEGAPVLSCSTPAPSNSCTPITSSSPLPSGSLYRTFRGLRVRGDDCLPSLAASWKRTLTPCPDVCYEAGWSGRSSDLRCPIRGSWLFPTSGPSQTTAAPVLQKSSLPVSIRLLTSAPVLPPLCRLGQQL